VLRLCGGVYLHAWVDIKMYVCTHKKIWSTMRFSDTPSLNSGNGRYFRHRLVSNIFSIKRRDARVFFYWIQLVDTSMIHGGSRRLAITVEVSSTHTYNLVTLSRETNKGIQYQNWVLSPGDSVLPFNESSLSMQDNPLYLSVTFSRFVRTRLFICLYTLCRIMWAY